MQAADLDCVLAWRNHPQVSSFMLSQQRISMDEHRAWFERACADRHRRLLIVETDDSRLGFVQFHGVEPGGVSDWGFYAAPDAPKGSGRMLGRAALGYAFDALELHKVCGQALAFNEASIRLHLALGFQREGTLRDQHHCGDGYHDLILFGLISNEWTEGATR